MGVTFLQHRIVTGLHSNSMPKSKGKRDGKFTFTKKEILKILYGIICVVYIYLLCLLLAGAVETASRITHKGYQFHRSYDIGLCVAKDWNSLLNSATIVVLMKVYSRRHNGIVAWILKFSSPNCYFSTKCSRIHFLSNMLSIWTTILNLVLLVICNTSILNPGPTENRRSHLKVMCQNVRGLVPFSSLGKSNNMPLDSGKLMELQSKIYKDKPDIIVLTETWLSKEHLDNEIFPDSIYKVYRRDRSKHTHPPDPDNPNKFRRKGGGVLVAVKANIDVENDKVNVSSKAEMISISLKANNISYCISACYRVGTLGEQNLNEIERHLRNVAGRKKFKAHFVVGDFNLPEVNWSEGQSSTQLGRRFVDLFNDLGLLQMISQPTHDKGKILDLLFSNLPGAVEDIVVLGKNEICSSDHFGISFAVKMNFRKKIGKRKIYNYKRANWEGLNNDLKSVKWDEHLRCDAETGWLRFKNILYHHINLRIPTITITDKDQPPWFDSETYHLCLKKEKLRAKHNETGLAEDYTKFSECRRDFKNLVNEKMISNFKDDDDPALISKKFWSHVKSTSKSSRIPGTVNYHGKFRNNSKDQAEMFNEYFEEQFSAVSGYDVDIDYHRDSENDIDFSISRIRKILKDVNVNKAAGPDGVHGKVLKNCRESIAYPLSCIFRISYNIGQIPCEWKLANVVPIHKKGPKTSVENYRPISLTSLVMKVFEKIVRDELLAKCQHKLNQNQHGFLPEKSCTTQMVNYVDSLSVSLNNNTRTDVVYFDFAKAFDSVNHDIILMKLKSEFGIDGILLKFIRNYLKDRKQRVVIGGSQSDLKNVRSGVPQGSILGPLFFVLFINDMSECVSEGTMIALYADDTKIWRKIVSWHDHEILQHDIDMLQNWAERNKMNFHLDKCKVLSVHNRASENGIWSSCLPFQVFIYTLNGIDLDFVKSEKDLGVIVTSNLGWEENILALYTKASSRLGLMKRTLRFIKDRKQKRAFYLALIRSLFEHCSIVWRPTTDTLNSKVESIQRKAVKWILGEQDHHYNDFEYLSRLKNLDLMPMEYKFRFTDLVMFHNIYHGQSVIKLPNYIVPMTYNDCTRLRRTIRQPPQFNEVESCGLPDLNQRRTNRYDSFSLKSVIEAKTRSFKSGFFFRTHLQWNDLPSELKGETNPGVFKSNLKKHLWDLMIDPD